MNNNDAPNEVERRGDFIVRSRRVAYENPWIRVIEDQVTRPDGNPGLFGVIEIGEGRGGVSILPVDSDGFAYLVREYMYAINENCIEIAGGGVDASESALSAAQRELKEEFGIEADTWIELGRVAHATTIMRAGATMYLAQNFDPKQLTPEEGLSIERYHLSELISMVEGGQLQASTTVCAILLAARKLGI